MSWPKPSGANRGSKRKVVPAGAGDQDVVAGSGDKGRGARAGHQHIVGRNSRAHSTLLAAPP